MHVGQIAGLRSSLRLSATEGFTYAGFDVSMGEISVMKECQPLKYLRHYCFALLLLDKLMLQVCPQVPFRHKFHSNVHAMYRSSWLVFFPPFAELQKVLPRKSVNGNGWEGGREGGSVTFGSSVMAYISRHGLTSFCFLISTVLTAWSSLLVDSSSNRTQPKLPSPRSVTVNHFSVLPVLSICSVGSVSQFRRRTVAS
jgi:hypothetical protein